MLVLTLGPHPHVTIKIFIRSDGPALVCPALLIKTRQLCSDPLDLCAS